MTPQRQWRAIRAIRTLRVLVDVAPSPEPAVVDYWLTECAEHTGWPIVDGPGERFQLHSPDGRQWLGLDLRDVVDVLEREWEW